MTALASTEFDEGVNVIALSGSELTAIECEVAVSRQHLQARGTIKFGSTKLIALSRDILVASICDVHVGELHLGIESDFERRVKFAESAALLSFIRSLCMKNLNSPRNGSVYAHAGSLPEQWNLLKRSPLKTPEWSLDEASLEGRDEPVKVNPFSLGAARSEGENEYLWVNLPVGVPCTRVFLPGHYQDFRVLDEGIESFAPSRSVNDALEVATSILEREKGIDAGEICYFFSGDLTFWSASSFLPAYSLRSPHGAPLMSALGRWLRA